MKIKANGIQMNYALSGREGAPVVVLSHSLGCSFVMWNPQLVLLESHFQVLRYDTRGHGGSDAPVGPYTLDQLGKDAVELLDALDIDVIHWVGLSMGGMIGQCLALEHAHRLRSLVLADTAAIIPEEAQSVWQERIDAARKEGMPVLVQSTLERWFTPNYLKRNLPGVESIRNQFLVTPVPGYIGCSEAIRGLNFLSRLVDIKTPTLIIVGEDDPGTPVAASEAMHERIQGSKLVLIPSCAHLSNIEQTEVFNDTLIAFLKDH